MYNNSISDEEEEEEEEEEDVPLTSELFTRNDAEQSGRSMLLGAHIRNKLPPSRLHSLSVVRHGDNLPQKAYTEKRPTYKLRVIQRLCQEGHLDRAVDALSEIDKPPCIHTYLSLLKACNQSKSLHEAQQVHAHLVRHQIPLNGFLGDYLVMTLARCGAAEDALELLPRLPNRTVFSWTAILYAYTEQGQGEHALKLYQFMLEDGVQPDAHTFVSLFKACGDKQDLVHGREFHDRAREKGWAADVFVGNTLMHMYGKCGALTEAEDVFQGLNEHNIVSWCTMLTVYVEQGRAIKAIHLYRQMFEENIYPDRVASMMCLQASGVLAESEELDARHAITLLLEIGKAIHAYGRSRGFDSELYFSSTLVSVYGKCAALIEAEHVFQAFQRNIVSWNAMLSAFVGQSEGEKALWLYKEMQQEGMSPNQLTFVFVLQACGMLAANEGTLFATRQLNKWMFLDIGHALHADAFKGGVLCNAVLGSALLSMYGKCGAIMEAEFVFSSLSEHNIVSWNSMMAIFVEQSEGRKAIGLYRQLKVDNIRPDDLTLAIALQACVVLVEREADSNSDRHQIEMVALEVGRGLHADARSSGSALVPLVGNTLVSMYAKCGSVVEAEHVFSALSERNLTSSNVMLKAYVDHGQEEKALWFFSQMEKHHVILDNVTIITMLQACSATGRLELCKQLHFCIVCVGFDQVAAVAATAVHAYGSCATILDARALFEEIVEPNITSWNAYIAGYTGEGNYIANLNLFDELKLTGVMPTEVTLTSVLSACCHAGRVMEGLEYYKSISEDYAQTPDTKHNGGLLNLLGRIGDFKRMDDMLRRQQVEVDMTAWLCLLGACRVHGHVQLARHAFDHVTELHPHEAPLYVLMSNVYADRSAV